MPKGGGKQKRYSKEFKLGAAYLLMSKAYSPKEVFQMPDVDRRTVYRWVQEFKASGETAFEKKAVLPGEEVRRLQKQNADLQMENEILKKPRHTLRNDTRKSSVCGGAPAGIPRRQSMPSIEHTTLQPVRYAAERGPL